MCLPCISITFLHKNSNTKTVVHVARDKHVNNIQLQTTWLGMRRFHAVMLRSILLRDR